MLASAKANGVQQFSILARASGQLVAAPLDLPDAKTAQGAAPSADRPLRLVVSVTSARLVVWSISGLEGTLQRPALMLDKAPFDHAPLVRSLGEIAARHPSNDVVVLMADGPILMQTIAELFGELRATAGGKPLFPNVRLSSGFE